MNRMYKVAGLAAGLALMAAAPLALAAGDTQADLQAQAKISKSAATTTAMTKVPNAKIVSSELENEGGELVYSFDLRDPSSNQITEVLVDAKTGAVGSTKKETAAEQANEAKVDRDAAKSNMSGGSMTLAK